MGPATRDARTPRSPRTAAAVQPTLVLALQSNMMPSEYDHIGQPARGSLAGIFCASGAVFAICLLPHARMRCPNTSCNRLLSPNPNGHTAHIVSDDTNALDIGRGVNFCSYCGTPLPASHRYPPRPWEELD